MQLKNGSGDKALKSGESLVLRDLKTRARSNEEMHRRIDRLAKNAQKSGRVSKSFTAETAGTEDRMEVPKRTRVL